MYHIHPNVIYILLEEPEHDAIIKFAKKYIILTYVNGGMIFASDFECLTLNMNKMRQCLQLICPSADLSSFDSKRAWNTRSNV